MSERDSEVGNLSVDQLSVMKGVDGMSVSRMINETEKQDDPLSDTDHPTEVTTVEEMSCRRLRVEQLSKMSVPDVPRMMNHQTIDEECVIVDRMSLARMPPSVEQLRQPNVQGMMHHQTMKEEYVIVDRLNLARTTPSVEQLSQPSVQGMMHHQTMKEECVIVNRMSLAKMPPSVEQLSRLKVQGMMNNQTMKDECAPKCGQTESTN